MVMNSDDNLAHYANEITNASDSGTDSGCGSSSGIVDHLMNAMLHHFGIEAHVNADVVCALCFALRYLAYSHVVAQ
jgi:galactokinase/mevalonate kinase-like predicted kinase